MDLRDVLVVSNLNYTKHGAAKCIILKIRGNLDHGHEAVMLTRHAVSILSFNRLNTVHFSK